MTVIKANFSAYDEIAFHTTSNLQKLLRNSEFGWSSLHKKFNVHMLCYSDILVSIGSQFDSQNNERLL